MGSANWGQAIGGFTEGFARGYGIVQDAEDRKRRREREDVKWKREDEEFARQDQERAIAADTIGKGDTPENLESYQTRLSAINPTKALELKRYQSDLKTQEATRKSAEAQTSLAELNIQAARRNQENQQKIAESWKTTQQNSADIERIGNSGGMRGLAEHLKTLGVPVTFDEKTKTIRAGGKVYTDLEQAKEAAHDFNYKYFYTSAMGYMSPKEIADYMTTQRATALAERKQKLDEEKAASEAKLRETQGKENESRARFLDAGGRAAGANGSEWQRKYDRALQVYMSQGKSKQEAETMALNYANKSADPEDKSQLELQKAFLKEYAEAGTAVEQTRVVQKYQALGYQGAPDIKADASELKRRTVGSGEAPPKQAIPTPQKSAPQPVAGQTISAEEREKRVQENIAKQRAEGRGRAIKENILKELRAKIVEATRSGNKEDETKLANTYKQYATMPDSAFEGK
jgi:hypothetical protein